MSTISHLDFNARLLSSFDDLFVANRDSTLHLFRSQWDQLCSDLMTSPSLNKDTGRLAYGVATQVEVLCQVFLDLEVSADEAKRRLADATTVEALHRNDQATSPPPTRYVKQAHDWLLDNLHNPFPSTSVRDEIGASVGSSRKSMDNWFIDARKYIGWNTLRQKFKTRKQMIEEATRYFKPSAGVSYSGEFDDEFQVIADRARRMFDDEDDHSSTRSGSEEGGASSGDESHDQAFKALPLVQASATIAEKQKRPSAPVPSQCALAGRKRRADDDSEPTESIQSKKRTRTDGDEVTRSSTHTPPTETSSPSSSSSAVSSSPSPSASQPVPTNRKRRLSESEGQSAPKRPRHQAIFQPGRSVSEPLTCANDWENWFKTAFTPEATPELDISTGELSIPDFDDLLSNSASSGPTTPETRQAQLSQQYEAYTAFDYPSPSNDSVASDFDSLLCGFDTTPNLSLGLGLGVDFGSTGYSQPHIVDSSKSDQEYWLPTPESSIVPLDGFELDGSFNSQLLNGKTVSLSDIPLPVIQF
ncbi:hypothetical protein VKT23_005348 [Stygiomarasmius scandens]|uniref:KN homeodomain domain-containing protein n=1 Tax=Marasmiellus scandens TaxID=2682957 RepID=A0ABR1JPU3_9AGAR